MPSLAAYQGGAAGTKRYVIHEAKEMVITRLANIAQSARFFMYRIPTSAQGTKKWET